MAAAVGLSTENTGHQLELIRLANGQNSLSFASSLLKKMPGSTQDENVNTLTKFSG